MPDHDSKFGSLFRWGFTGALGITFGLVSILYAQTDKRLEAGEKERAGIKADNSQIGQRIVKLETTVSNISATLDRLEKQVADMSSESNRKQDLIFNAISDLRVEAAKKK